jgi:hypothetical protein
MPPANPHLSLPFAADRTGENDLCKRTSSPRNTLSLTQPRNLCRGCGEDFTSTRLFDEHRVGKHEYVFDAWEDSKADCCSSSR